MPLLPIDVYVLIAILTIWLDTKTVDTEDVISFTKEDMTKGQEY